MAITKKQIAHMAGLARLRLTKEQEELFTRQLGQILEYMEVLKKVNTDGVEPTYHVIRNTITIREDEIKHPQSKDSNLTKTLERNDNFFVVPKVI